jgi:hypothetical protein
MANGMEATVKACLLNASTTNDTYEVDIDLVVCRDQETALFVLNKWTGEDEKDTDFGAMCCWNGCRFFLLFRNDYLEHRVIAHEIMHCTARIMQYVGVRFDPDNHEAYACLQGSLARWVYGQLKKAGLRIK